MNCEDKTCEDLYKPLLRHEARTVFECKMHLAAINGLLLEATCTFPEELLSQCKSFVFLTPDKYASYKALLEMFFPNHFHLRILSENPKACKEILVFSNIVSEPCRAVLNEYIAFKFQNEDARARRESSDLRLSVMKAFLLSSGYPEEFEKLIFEEEDDYNRELNLALSKAKDSPKCKRHRGEIKGIDGRHGMLLPDKNTENTGTHLCFIRLLENSFEQHKTTVKDWFFLFYECPGQEMDKIPDSKHRKYSDGVGVPLHSLLCCPDASQQELYSVLSKALHCSYSLLGFFVQKQGP